MLFSVAQIISTLDRGDARLMVWLSEFMEEPARSSRAAKPLLKVKARITDALQKNTPTEGVEIIGIGTTKTEYITRFRDEAFKNTASVNEEWLRNLGN
ncbi:hypothetical protein AJ78_07468 [Emergomyces pasteurianus Ep9510]|uniref:Uncharacterized protein n=1 Tax=Emergomyces pasteurianus Ep9510 TaxID=1447872 RepID=A0A1J9Q7E0_9EURO|nr:hypothetical protein AJ78_07468 [Emergomyces pasteurianus Ep9510]